MQSIQAREVAVLGDFNARVGRQLEEENPGEPYKVLGRHGLPERNENGIPTGLLCL